MRTETDLRALREEAREHATDLRARALAVDERPDDLSAHLGCPGFRAIQRTELLGHSTLATVAGLVELARGDAGMVLACPGASLAGVLIRVMGSEEQQARLHEAIADGRTWTFLAITEPGAGSDATRLTSELRSDGEGGYRLYGTKRYIGNGSRGTFGVVLARTGANPLSLRAAIVRVPAASVRAEPLDMVGLRGARISELTFDGLPVGPDDLLGGHLSRLRRGMWGVIQAFNTVRVQVAAMAVGTALAAHGYVRDQRASWTAWERAELDAAATDIEATRLMVERAAAEVDADRQRTYHAALAKLAAVALGKRVTARLPRLLGRGAMLEHPLLEKWWRDASAFEFMEGTSHIQRLHVAQGYLKEEAGNAR